MGQGPPTQVEGMKLTLVLISAAVVLAACGGRVTGTGDPPSGESAAMAQRSADPNDVWLAFDVSGPESGVQIMRADGSARRRLDLGMRIGF